MAPYEVIKKETNLITRFHSPMNPTQLVTNLEISRLEIYRDLQIFIRANSFEKLDIPKQLLVITEKIHEFPITQYKATFEVAVDALSHIFRCAKLGKTFQYDDYIPHFHAKDVAHVHKLVQYFLTLYYDMMLHLAHNKEHSNGIKEYVPFEFEQTYSNIFTITHAEFLLTRNQSAIENSNYLNAHSIKPAPVDPLTELELD